MTALEDAAIELKSLHNRVGAKGRFSFGSADLMRETLGVEPGAVTPLGALNDLHGRVTVVLDAALMHHDIINAHPLVNTMTTSIARETWCDSSTRPATRHRIVALAGPAAEAG